MTTTQKPDKVIVAACRALEADPANEHDKIDEKALLDAKVYLDQVVVVIATGQKYTVRKDALQFKRKQVPKADAVKTDTQKK